jgi:toluene monooxygenase system protein D
MQDAVGPVLRMCEEIELVIQAIIDDNPDREIEVNGSGSYVRVQTRGFMRVTLDSLQRNVGRTFQMRQLGAMLSSFAGRIATTSDEFRWSLTSLPTQRGSVPPEKESSG